MSSELDINIENVLMRDEDNHRVSSFFTTISLQNANGTYVTAYMRYGPANWGQIAEERPSLFEYPVQDDGKSPMWDMNQRINHSGILDAKRIR